VPPGKPRISLNFLPPRALLPDRRTAADPDAASACASTQWQGSPPHSDQFAGRRRPTYRTCPDTSRERRRMDDAHSPGRVSEVPERAPLEPWPAATLVLVRPGAGGREVLLLRRPSTSSFAPDAWVFPGGRVDDSDWRLDHDRLAAGPSAAEWATVLAIDSPPEAGAYVVAAVREAWEETGILLATAGHCPPGCDRARKEVLSGMWTLAEYLDAAKLRLASAELRYIGHWITPEWLPRRFDTRFFLTEVGRDARCELSGEELVEFRWMLPELALRAAELGEVRLLPPTLDTLRRIAKGEL
jgi:8-oxo-dGTP pyrophosphatase MutT (NUDIX family)